MENMNKFFEEIKRILSSRKTKATLYIAAVLWLAVITQVVMNRFFREEIQITQAFVNTNTGDLKSSLEFVAEYHENFLSEIDKKRIIHELADAIGLSIDHEITVLRDGDRVEYEFYKKAKYASTQLKVISVEVDVDATTQIRHYVIVRLAIKDSIQSTDRYRKLIEEALRNLGIEDQQLTIQYEGSFPGILSEKERDIVTKELVEELQGAISMKYETDDIYTVYGYTALFREYIVTMGSKVNIQVAVSYDEVENKTIVKLATPIINQNW